MTHDRDNTRSAAVDRDYHWLPITEVTLRGVKLQLIDKRSGVASYGMLQAGNSVHWTHWAPLPTFEKVATCRAAPQGLTDDDIWRSDEIMRVNARLALQMPDLVALARAVESIKQVKP